MHSICLVIDLHTAANNVKQLSAAKETLEFALLYFYKILYCCQKYKSTYVLMSTGRYVLFFYFT